MKFFQRIFSQPFFPLVLAFIALNLFVTQDGGQNAASRLLAMRSFGDHGSFRMDAYLKSTDDWSRSEDGRYFSNKAPGPMLLGFPVFFVADKLHQVVEKEPADGIRPHPAYMQNTITSFVMQVLPFALLALACAAWLGQMGYSIGSQAFFLLAVLFGNTASIFMNSYFGHGFAALLQLAGVLFLLKRRYGFAGMMFSFSLLSDYGFAMQIPALLAALALERPNKKEALQFAGGAIPGALLWIIYHSLAFGSPFAIASRFQNPVFLEGEGSSLWGMLSQPQWPTILELIVGPSRGLILSQPWLFLVIPAAIWFSLKKRERSPLGTATAFCLFSLAGLILMNASFNGWHGGATAGPRYLSGILPVCALLAALVYDRWHRLGIAMAWALLAVALVFRSLVYGGTILAPLTPLWPYYFEELFSRGTPVLRAFVFFLCAGLALFWVKKRTDRLGSSSGNLA